MGDGQHGLLGYSGMLAALTAIDAAAAAVGLGRVAANDVSPIGRALDAGAAGVIVPLVNSAEEAASAVAACRYPPAGVLGQTALGGPSAGRVGAWPRSTTP